MKKDWWNIEIGDQLLRVEIIEYPEQKGMKDNLGQEIEPTVPSYIEIVDIFSLDGEKFDLYNLLFELDSSSKPVFKQIEEKVWDKIYEYGKK